MRWQKVVDLKSWHAFSQRQIYRSWHAATKFGNECCLRHLFKILNFISSMFSLCASSLPSGRFKRPAVALLSMLGDFLQFLVSISRSGPLHFSTHSRSQGEVSSQYVTNPLPLQRSFLYHLLLDIDLYKILKKLFLFYHIIFAFYEHKHYNFDIIVIVF